MNDIVLIHGALGASSQFDSIKPLLEKKYKVHVYEIIGHGKRANESIEFSIENFASDFEKFLSRFNKPVKVFGFSMGGYLALFLSLSKPELFSEIITLGTKFHWTAEEASKETAKLNVEVLEAKVPQYCSYLKSLHGEDWKPVVEKTKQLMLKLGANPLLTPETVQGINIPVTVMLGELDKMVSREETCAIQEKIPRSAFKLINGFVHPLEKLDPAGLTQTLI